MMDNSNHSVIRPQASDMSLGNEEKSGDEIPSNFSSNSASVNELSHMEEGDTLVVDQAVRNRARTVTIVSPKDIVTNPAMRDRAMTFSPLVQENAPIILSWSNMTVTTRKEPKKTLLDNISGSITGGFWAIMGASGGGKTTLLSTLSLRLDSNVIDVVGEFRLNGAKYSKHILKSMSAYVMQDDLLHAELTVFETLNYAANLRLPKGFTKEQRADRVEEVLALMGITYCKEVIIGDTRRKGISGGERKRVCVAIELLTSPKLVFLDEPTSGLDSTTALAVCETLKKLSASGQCTVVCTIHQPQQKIFELFDNLILMKKGNIVYQGSCLKSIRFLENVGLPCPEGINPADYLIDVINPNRKDHASLLIDDNGKLEVPVNLSFGFDKPSFSKEGASSWIAQFTILFQRNMQQYWRRKDIIVMNFVVTVLLAIFIGLGVWHNIGNDQTSIKKRIPSLFFACVTQGIVASLQSINSFPAERALMLRERSAGTYYVSSYFMAKTAKDFLTNLWQPMLFTCIVYFLIGYQVKADKFFIYMMFMVLDTFAATSLATAVTCTFVSIEMSTVVLASMLEISRLYGGFFTSPLQLASAPNWRFADALSYLKYAFVGVALNELHGLELTCLPSDTTCILTGQQLIVNGGYDQYSIGFLAGILSVFIVGCRVVAFLGLKYVKN
jgi:ABC-type multidrug transport system ATPase subunit